MHVREKIVPQILRPGFRFLKLNVLTQVVWISGFTDVLWVHLLSPLLVFPNLYDCWWTGLKAQAVNLSFLSSFVSFVCLIQVRLFLYIAMFYWFPAIFMRKSIRYDQIMVTEAGWWKPRDLLYYCLLLCDRNFPEKGYYLKYDQKQFFYPHSSFLVFLQSFFTPSMTFHLPNSSLQNQSQSYILDSSPSSVNLVALSVGSTQILAIPYHVDILSTVFDLNIAKS